MRFESESTKIAAGQSLVIDPPAVHQAANESAGEVEFLVVSCPPSHGDRFIPDE